MPYLATNELKQAEVERLQQVYDRAITGETEIEIEGENGSRVKYTNPNLTEIRRRIIELRSEIAQANGETPARSGVRAFIG